ncbi:MAG: pilus assembly protein PilV [Pelagibacterales bacterium MED-G44]|nr:MAG: pilus assembly protein PilV [Pelagibacterales bacterium MED-G44]|tara:strand:- start:573 stop:1505 length:933 start_codon:yes stop_codon:yes gene_type:complete
MNRKLNKISGVTLIELLVGVAVTALMMGAMFASYTAVNSSYKQVTDKARISSSSRDIVGMMMKDIRLAGFKYYYGKNDEDIPFADNLTHVTGLEDGRGIIDSHDPIIVFRNTLGYSAADVSPSSPPSKNRTTDTCCDRIHIVYGDFDKNDPKQKYKRYRLSYFALPIDNEDGDNDNDFYGVYKTKESWIENSETPFGNWTSSCTECYRDQLVRSHLIDMEFLLFDENGHDLWKDGDYPLPDNDNRAGLYKIRQVDMSLMFRSNKEFFKTKPKKKKYLKTLNKDRYGGVGFDDKYLRDNVVVSVNTRNIGG